MKICVVGGSGYVGFITGLGFAELGNDVVNVDIDATRVAQMNAGRSPIFEENVNLDEILGRNLHAGRIRFTTEIEEGITGSEVVFIAVGTPEREDGEADLSQVIAAAEQIGRFVDSYRVLVMKSTVPVGTLDLVCSILSRTKTEGVDFDVASNPEFLREGKGLYDFFHPTRIVVGAHSEKALKKLRSLYSPFLRSPVGKAAEECEDRMAPVPDTPFIETDIASAQMIKYASNAFLATRISYINEIASVCEHVGADVGDVVRGMGLDPRIGPHYLQPGPGFGGPCLEKDIKALIAISTNHGYEAQFLRSVLQRNEAQLKIVLLKIREIVGYPMYRKRIGVLGLAFKAGTNDVRTSLSVRVIEELIRQGVEVQAHDPVAMDEARQLLPDVQYCESPYAAAEKADAVVLLTEWDEYRSIDLKRLAGQMTSPRIVDAKNWLDGEALANAGFLSVGVGRAGRRRAP